jgi:hypothetical protein
MHLGLRTIGIPLLPARVSSQAALTRCLAALGGLAVAHLRSVVAVKSFQPLASFFPETYRLVQLRVRYTVEVF